MENPDLVKLEVTPPDFHIRTVCAARTGGFSLDTLGMKDEFTGQWEVELARFKKATKLCTMPCTKMDIDWIKKELKDTPLHVEVKAMVNGFIYTEGFDGLPKEIEKNLKEAGKEIERLLRVVDSK